MEFRELSFEDAFTYVNDTLDIEVEQVPSELRWAFKLATDHLGGKGKVALEIGSYVGGNLCMLSRLLSNDGLLISIEPELCGPVDERVATTIYPVEYTLVRWKSQDPEAIREVEDILRDRYIDILFIDGEHNYTAVHGDWSNYSPMVGCPGVVIFHDLIGGEAGPTRLFPELVNRGYEGYTMCTDSVRYGTGVILI